MVTLPTGLTGEHRTQFEGYRAWAGNDSALTHPSAFPQLPVGAAETARRELPIPSVESGGQPQGRESHQAPPCCQGQKVLCPLGAMEPTMHRLLKTGFI